MMLAPMSKICMVLFLNSLIISTDLYVYQCTKYHTVHDTTQYVYKYNTQDYWSVIVNLQSVQFSRSVVSDSLQPYELQHTRPPCPSPTPRVYPNSCPLSWWCHPTISSSVIPFFSWPQSFPASGSFRMSPFFASGGQRKYWSFSFIISPSSEHPGLISFRMDWLDLLAVQGTLKSLLQYHSSKPSIL